jgi:hypothetical protein
MCLARRGNGAIQAERERMKAGLRLGRMFWAAALALVPVSAPAQQADPAQTSTPSPAGTVGPQDLQNFSLQGNVTRPADQPAAAAPSPAAKPRAQSPITQNVVQPVAGAPAEERAAPVRRETASATPAPTEPAPARSAIAERASTETLRQTPPASSVTVALPHLNGAARSSAVAPVPVATAGLDSPQTVPPEHKLSILPWLLAAFALGAGAAFLFLRHRREALAGGPDFDAFAAPEPEPAPAPAPAPRAQPKAAPAPAPERPAPSIPGIVSTRLRPWLEIGFQPTRCLVEDHQVTFEFEVELLNSGNAPARDVLVEASLFNASNSQDEELEAFFANPRAEGDRIPAIQPLKRIRVASKVVTGREHVQVYDIGGRKVFVPIIAFNALYRWRGGEAQTSASYLLGVDTKGEKMAPFRVDLGPRLFAVTARQLATGVRR